MYVLTYLFCLKDFVLCLPLMADVVWVSQVPTSAPLTPGETRACCRFVAVWQIQTSCDENLRAITAGLGCLCSSWCCGLPAVLTSSTPPCHNLMKHRESCLSFQTFGTLIGKYDGETFSLVVGGVWLVTSHALSHFNLSWATCILSWKRDKFVPALLWLASFQFHISELLIFLVLKGK